MGPLVLHARMRGNHTQQYKACHRYFSRLRCTGQFPLLRRAGYGRDPCHGGTGGHAGAKSCVAADDDCGHSSTTGSDAEREARGRVARNGKAVAPFR